MKKKKDKVFDILDIYFGNKKCHKHKKGEAIYYSLKEIQQCIVNTKVTDGFVKVYKFYKKLLFTMNTVIPNLLLGLGAGIIATIVGYFLQMINDTILLTLSNLLFVSVGFLGVLILYIVSYSAPLFLILVPYTVEQMEKRIDREIESENNDLLEKEEKHTYKALVVKKHVSRMNSRRNEGK